MTDGVLSCLDGVAKALSSAGITPGSITHTIGQLQTTLQLSLQQFAVKLEDPALKGQRIVDVVATRITDGLKTLLHAEIKSGEKLGPSLKFDQLKADAQLALKQAADKTVSDFINVWRFTNLEFTGKAEQTIQKQLQKVADELGKGMTPAQLRKAIESFDFVDKVGNEIRFTLGKNGKVMFDPAMEIVFGSDGLLAQTATKKAGNSPNFNPAMELVLGPGGKMTDAATKAAGGANFDPALNGLEKKLEEGIGGALDKAGKSAEKLSAKQLADKVSSGVSALGNAISAVPALHASLKDLGEAWNKPLKSTDDYMNLMSKLGGAVSQAGSTLQAFSAITELASAAQAIFNAVMAMNPVVLIVIAVVALIAAIVLLIVYWDEVKAALRDNPWLAVLAAMFGIIGVIVLVIAYWDEIVLAVLKAANSVSIQAQRIAQFFVGIGTVAGMVWDFISASVENVGISILNAFTSAGASIQNFFIGMINGLIEKWNLLAETLGGTKIELLPKADVEANLIPPKQVPKIDVDAAFTAKPVTGGLEGEIAKREEAVAKAREEDEKRRKQKAEQAAAPPGAAPGALPPAGLPGVPGAPALPAVPGAPAVPAMPAVPAGEGAAERPALPAMAPLAAAAPGAGPVDQSVHVGTISVTINADKLEADASKLLSDEIVSALQARLGSLRSEQNFRVGER